MPLVELTGVSFGYTRGIGVLENIDLEVERGEFVGIAGPNGGGKTTLVRLIVGLERPRQGRVTVLDQPPHRLKHRSRVGYLPQRTQLGLGTPTTVEELVTAGRTAASGFLGPLRARDRAEVEAAVDRVGLSHVRKVPLQRLSGGQQQRAFIAKALAAQPELLVLDEPTVGVDVASQEALAVLLDELSHESGMTILYVSHEFGVIEPYVARLVLVRGGIVFDGAPEHLARRWHDPSHVHP